MKCLKCGSKLLSTGRCSNLMCGYENFNTTYKTKEETEELILEKKDDIIKQRDEEKTNEKENKNKTSQKYSEDTDKVWDMTFKTLLLETPKLFLPLIKEVFGVDYSRDRKIVLLNNEYYNKEDGKVIADTIFSIGTVKYHFECQYSNDKSMVFRMFEYDFHVAVSKIKEDEEYFELNFPKSCVVYITANKKIPTELNMKLNFQNGESIEYKVPTIRVQDYSLGEIEERGLLLFTPFLILRYTDKLKNKKRPSQEEIYQFYKEIIEILNKMSKEGKITELEANVLIEAIKHTEEYALRNYPEYQEGVENMMSETLKLKSLEAIKEAKLEAEIKGKLEGRLEGRLEGKLEGRLEGEKEAAKKMLKTMHEDGVDIEYIKKLGRKQGLTEEEIEDIVGLKK